MKSTPDNLRVTDWETGRHGELEKENSPREVKRYNEEDNEVKWQVRDGYLEVMPKTGDIVSKEEFGDCQLHKTRQY